MSDSITIDRLENNLALFNKMYDGVRLVDPVKKRVIEYRAGSRSETEEICYDYWGNGKICDNCISVRAYLGDKCYLKLEKSADAILMVTALPLENADRPTVLELLKNATDTMMIGNGSYQEGRMLNNLVSELNDLAVKDKLTGIYNRRFVDERLPADIVKAAMEKLPLSVIFLDVDSLKQINDTYGHAIGDKALIGVTQAISRCIRADIDWAARYGGDEFLVCLYNTENDEAYNISERIRSTISALILPEEGAIRISASLGVYTMEDSSVTSDELISLADRRMYQAKKGGKDRTVAKDNLEHDL